MITVQDLTLLRGERVVSHLASLRVEAGERVLVQGSNGSGKSTFLRALAGLHTELLGSLVVDAPPAERVFVHQRPYLFRGSVAKNLSWGLRARGRGELAAALAWGERLGLAGLERRPARSLSGGEQRRLALARALALEPALILFDEPFAELDEASARALGEGLEHLGSTTVVFSSPTAIEVAETRPTQVVLLEAGGSHSLEAPKFEGRGV